MIVTFLVGFLNEAHVSNNVIGDAGMYILSFMIFLLVSENRIKAKPMRELLLFVFHAMTVNLAINCMMYFTKNFSFWGLESFNGGRFGGGYYSLLIISVVYGFYDFMSEKRISAKEFYLHMGMAAFCSILAQSRTHVFLCLAGFVLVFCFRPGKLSVKYLIRAFIVIGIVAIILFINSGNPLVERILSTNIHSSTETTASRIYTWTYYWRRICENPTGTGFGEIMYFINPSLTIAASTATYYVDNAYAVVLYKRGFLYGVLYFIPLYATLVKLIISWRKTRNNAYLMYAAIWVMFIFVTTVLTSEIIHTYAVNAFAWIFTGCV